MAPQYRLAQQSFIKRTRKSVDAAYLSDHQVFLCALSQNKIKRQKTLKHFLPGTSDPHLLRLKRKKADATSKFSKARLTLRQAQLKADADVELKSLLWSKENHKVVGERNIIPGTGPFKDFSVDETSYLFGKRFVACKAGAIPYSLSSYTEVESQG
jgi:hypothetical protein